MTIKLRISTPQGPVDASCFAHPSTLPDERLIESEFYEKYRAEGSVPQGLHHELELREGIWDQVEQTHIHIYVHPKSRRKFVCWTGTISTFENAMIVFKAWAVGTVFTVFHGEDFVPLAQKFGPDFLDHMRAKHQIFIL